MKILRNFSRFRTQQQPGSPTPQRLFQNPTYKTLLLTSELSWASSFIMAACPVGITLEWHNSITDERNHLVQRIFQEVTKVSHLVATFSLLLIVMFSIEFPFRLVLHFKVFDIQHINIQPQNQGYINILNHF